MTDSVRVIGSKTFQSDDQLLFARLSNDVNPMHMDPVAARRLITGRQVVHGIHILLCALEYWAGQASEALVSLECTFNNPVSVGELVVFSCRPGHGKASIIEASVEGLVCAHITLHHAVESVSKNLDGAGIYWDTFSPTAVSGAMDKPFDHPPEAHAGKLYALPLKSVTLVAGFPHCQRLLGPDGLAATLALSYFVGMVVPGLNSVFSSCAFRIGTDPAVQGCLWLLVRKYDPRFRLFDIQFTGLIEGGIRAFVRPVAQTQPSTQELADLVDAREFAGTRSLVIGGSRGLGELTAKLVSAGGGDTVITYATGVEDARAIADEINRGSRGRCQTMRLDLSRDRFDGLDIDWASVSVIYFFATPRIFRKKSGLFDVRLFNEFCDVYVVKLHELCVFLEKQPAGGKVRVYLPSTVFVVDRPKGMAEYAMAKSAAELLAQEINRGFRRVEIFTTRLPRLTTDQTASIVKLSAGDNLGALLPVIRSMQAA